MPEIGEDHVSVAFTHDMPKAEALAEVRGKTGLPVKWEARPLIYPEANSSPEGISNRVTLSHCVDARTVADAAPYLHGRVGGVPASAVTLGFLREVRAARMYFAYDTPDDLGSLVEAGRRLCGTAGSRKRRTTQPAMY